MRTPVIDTCSGSIAGPRPRRSMRTRNIIKRSYVRTDVRTTVPNVRSNVRLNDPLNYNFQVKQASEIAPAEGKLGILLVGLGAVSTTTIAGVIAIRKGLAQPIGSLTQMGTIRLGKRTDNRSPRISEVVPLSGLDDVVFGGWDIFDDDCYAAAKTAGVLEPALLQQIRPELEQIAPGPGGSNW